MRSTATSITIFLLLLSACSPQPQADLKAELNKLSGPSPSGMDDSLKTQAEQAVAAGNYAVAAQVYKQLSDKEPENKDYALALAANLRRAGDSTRALNVLDAYLLKHPQDAQALEDKGLCLMNMGSVAEAGKTFEGVLKIEPNRWRSLNAVGILFTLKNKLPEAVTYYDEALRFSPENGSVMNNKALTLATDGKYDASIETFQDAKRHLRVGSPEMRQIDLNLALVYAIAGKLDDAERTAAPYLSKVALYNNMGVYADLAKNPDMSKSYLNMALTQSPVYYERAWKNLNSVGDAKKTPGKLPQLTQITEESSSPSSKSTTKPATADSKAASDSVKKSSKEKSSVKNVESKQDNKPVVVEKNPDHVLRLPEKKEEPSAAPLSSETTSAASAAPATQTEEERPKQEDTPVKVGD